MIKENRKLEHEKACPDGYCEICEAYSTSCFLDPPKKEK